MGHPHIDRYLLQRASVGALLPAAAILVIAATGNARNRTITKALVAALDSAAAHEIAIVRRHREALHAAEQLPPIRLIDSAGQIVQLDSLPSLGYRYLYFFREDCLACQRLMPLLRGTKSPQRDAVAHIAIDYHESLVPPHDRAGYAVVPDSGIRRIVATVPSLLVVDASGQVVATADFSSYRVAQLLDMYGLLPLEDANKAFLRDSTPVPSILEHRPPAP